MNPNRTPTDIIAEACAMRDTFAPTYSRDGWDEGQLRALAPGLDLARYETLLTTIFAASPTSRRDVVPITVELTEAQRAELAPAFEELGQQVALLKKAGALFYASEPRAHWRVVIATMAVYRDTHDVNGVTDKSAITSISMQDLLYQVPEAAGDLPHIGEFPNLEVLVLFGNDMRDFPIPCDRLTKLRSLDLSENALGAFPERLLACTALEWVNLSANPIRYIPPGIERLQRLKYLDLSGSQLLPADVAKLRAKLPSCVVETERRIYTDAEKLYNLVLNAPDFVFLGGRTLGGGKTTGGCVLPRNAGVHIVAGNATVPNLGEVSIVAEVDSGTGAIRAHHRGGSGAWNEVQFTAVTLRYPLAPATGDVETVEALRVP